MTRKKTKHSDDTARNAAARKISRLKELRMKELDAHYSQHLKRLRNILAKFRKKRSPATDDPSEPPIT